MSKDNTLTSDHCLFMLCIGINILKNKLQGRTGVEIATLIGIAMEFALHCLRKSDQSPANLDGNVCNVPLM